MTSACHQAFIRLDPDHGARAPRQWQGEIADAAEEIEHLGVLIHFEELNGTRDEALIDLGVDLDEIGRREFKLEGEGGQRIAQRLLGSYVRQTPHGIKSALLQIQPHAVFALERAQHLKIGVAGRGQHPQHECHGIVGN